MKEAVQQIIEEVNLRVVKNYKKMSITQLSSELREAMEFERETFLKIEELEKRGTENELIHYAKVICKNTTGREISEIQEAYLAKIDTEYLNSK